MKLTAAAVAALEIGDVADRIIFDDDVPGFGIRIRASGKRSWIFQYKIAGKTRRIALGNVSAIKVAKAREIASGYHADIRRGGDPATEKRDSVARASNTFGNLVDRFLTAYAARPKTVDEVRRHLRKYATPLHAKPVDAIGLRDIADVLTRIEKESGAVSANRVRSTLSTVFAWALREGLALSNPVVNTNKRVEKARERVLSARELCAIWNALGDDDYGAIVKLLILTGQRRSEIAELSWDEIDLGRGAVELLGERTKNHRAHTVPLAPTAVGILAQRERSVGAVFACTSWHERKQALDKRSGVTGWTLHDLRRTFVTGCAELGVAPHIIEAVVNHVSGHKGGVAGIYNRASYAAEKSAALARWDEHIIKTVLPLACHSAM